MEDTRSVFINSEVGQAIGLTSESTMIEIAAAFSNIKNNGKLNFNPDSASTQNVDAGYYEGGTLSTSNALSTKVITIAGYHPSFKQSTITVPILCPYVIENTAFKVASSKLTLLKEFKTVTIHWYAYTRSYSGDYKSVSVYLNGEQIASFYNGTGNNSWSKSTNGIKTFTNVKANTTFTFTSKVSGDEEHGMFICAVVICK